MRFSSIATALALSRAACAFTDSSPWILLSSSALHGQPNPHQMQSSSEAVQYTKEFLRECPTDEYLIVTQPGVNAADLRQSEGCAMPHLCKAIDDSRVRGKYIVAEVIGNITDADFQDHIKSSCARKGRTAKVVRAPLELLSGSRAKSLAKNDEKLAKTISTLSTRNSYTILFHATPQEPLYNSEFIEPLHTHMKRSDGNTLASKRANETQRDTRPLFEKYQFFTPGIFMGLIVALVLFSILGAGVRGLASLKVSYGAFDKEMGPAAQKKQQ